MINMLYTLHKKYSNKEMYIWNVNRDAMTVFELLAFRKINIAGFVTVRDEFVLHSLINRKIVGIEYLKNRNNVLIIASDNCNLSDADFKKIPKHIKVLHYSDILALNEKIKNEGVIIFGTGEGGEEIYRSLTRENVRIDAFCVSRADEEFFFHNRPVITLDVLNQKKNKPVIIAVKRDDYKIEILRKLCMFHIKNIFVDEITDIYLEEEGFFPAINKALVEHKKIFIYGCKDEISEFLEEVLAEYEIEVDGYVNDDESVNQKIGNVYDLYYLDVSKVFVIINELFPIKLQRMCSVLDEIGLSLEAFNYVALRRTAVEYINAAPCVVDMLVGAGVLVDDKIPGYYVYGDQRLEDVRIMVLGGSTSADGAYRSQCWSKYLYEKLSGEGYAVTIYNGSYPGHDVVQELLRLLRDGAVLKPDIVISMSGFNNTSLKEEMTNQFNVPYHIEWIKALDAKRKVISGLKSEEKLCDFWYRIERTMKVVAGIYGAEFYGFLQPMQCAKVKMNLFETGVFLAEKRKEFVKQYREYADDMRDIINLISRFDCKEGMFIDFCHYSDKANIMLAEIVYAQIIDSLEELEKSKRRNSGYIF